MSKFIKTTFVAIAIIGLMWPLTTTHAVAGSIETESEKSVSGLDLGSGRIWDWWGS